MSSTPSTECSSLTISNASNLETQSNRVRRCFDPVYAIPLATELISTYIHHCPWHFHLRLIITASLLLILDLAISHPQLLLQTQTSSTAILLKLGNKRTDVSTGILISLWKRPLNSISNMVSHAVYQGIGLGGVILDAKMSAFQFQFQFTRLLNCVSVL